MATRKLTPGDTVRIKKYIGDEFNEYGRIDTVFPDGDVWVTNMNMPWMGTVNARFKPDEVERNKGKR